MQTSGQLACSILLLAALLPAAAQAAPLRKLGSDKESTLYLERGSIQRGKDGRKAWLLQSYRQAQTAPDGKIYRSLKQQHLYSCEDRSITLVSQLYYAEPMARGEALATYKYESYDAEPVEKGSRYERALKAVCARKR
ncbi:hypothetical protein MJ904_00520 [Massilia sp. MB5]|uniref:surface-adhesin E family protein n=1 Tax=unclassified Massilia TaxID=2609279 RepID=UPI00067B22DE|nr:MULTISPECIES: surface-adhesin E family protein [unclassified Massilia]AKU24211.1 hypothetical protein ACZ75_24900 [Massilia sp. NR 4-1]UMR30796.1 hypothetical protein MJ904_00520 [Massilia sp. MB5]